MTEIATKVIEFKKGIRFCAVDNHNHKTGKTYDVIYSAKTPQQLYAYLIQKGIICR